MPFKDIIFGDYAPDRGGLPFPKDPGYLVQASNVRPTSQGYRPMAIDAEVASASTLSVTPNSAMGFSTSSTPHHYAGSSTALHESDDYGVTWYDNSKAAYTTSAYWDFALFETYVIAVNGVDAPQFKLITAAIADNFADLAGSPPTAGRAARVRDHLVLGKISTNVYKLQWGTIGDPTSWPTPGSADALADQAGEQELPRELGPISQIVGGEKFGLVFQTFGITRMTYVGGNVVYTFDTYERARGSGHNRSAIMVDGNCYYASELGIFRTDGYAVENLSAGMVEDSIVRDFLSLTEAGNYGYSVAYDSRTSTVMWSKATGYVLCYHVLYKRFSILTLAGSPSVSGTLYSATNGASNDIAIQVPMAFNNTPRLVAFDDTTAVPTTLRTGYFELGDGFSEIVGLEPLGKGTSIAAAVKSIAAISSADVSSASYNAASSPTRSHLYRIRQSGRYHSLKLTGTAAAGDLYQGIRVHYENLSRL